MKQDCEATLWSRIVKWNCEAGLLSNIVKHAELSRSTVKQDFQWGCQAGLSWRMSSRDINQNFYIGLASTTVELDCQVGLMGWTVKEKYEAALWSRPVKGNCEAELRSRTMGQDCEGELWSRTVKQYWQTGQWCRTIGQSCQEELKASLNCYLLNQNQKKHEYENWKFHLFLLKCHKKLKSSISHHQRPPFFDKFRSDFRVQIPEPGEGLEVEGSLPYFLWNSLWLDWFTLW